MENKLIMCHETLTNIYDKAENILEELEKQSYNVTLESFSNHFIKINGEFVEQNYFMPVISVAEKGDICFNLDGEQFEFYVTKDELLNEIDVDSLLNEFKDDMSVYEFDDCKVDVYALGDSKDELLDKISKSNDFEFGVSFNCSDLSVKELIAKFDKASSLLGF